MTTYVVTTRYVVQRNEDRLSKRPAHREWLGRLREAGTLVNAGPFADEAGALLIFDVADEEALRATLAQDPYPEGSVDYTVLGEWKHLFPLA